MAALVEQTSMTNDLSSNQYAKISFSVCSAKILSDTEIVILNRKKVLAGKLTEFIKTYIVTENQSGNTDNDVIRQGYLEVGRKLISIMMMKFYIQHAQNSFMIHSGKPIKYWVILKPKTLTFGLGGNPVDIAFTLELDGLKFRLMKDGDSINRKIILFKPNGGNVLNEPLHKELILSSKKSKDISLWRESLSSVIVSLALFLLPLNRCA